ncbi:hypothetical protein ACFPOE_11480 [Caenimonas terrae]|uniref:Uncharacterized protein n=1 Tax=Caenimonas terrae TaxID=696074 RepID=A0ABW0NGB5_9BURK
MLSQVVSERYHYPRLQLPKLELLFRDGSSVWLHQMRADLCLRSVDVDGERIEVDLRDLAPSLDDEVPAAAPADRAGVLFFTLRHRFDSAQDFVRAAREHAR